MAIRLCLNLSEDSDRTECDKLIVLLRLAGVCRTKEDLQESVFLDRLTLSNWMKQLVQEGIIQEVENKELRRQTYKVKPGIKFSVSIGTV